MGSTLMNTIDNKSSYLSEPLIFLLSRGVAASHLQTLYELLLPEEAETATRFPSEVSRIRFVVSRSVTRLLVSLAVPDTNPDAVRFTVGRCGKPALCGEAPWAAVSFNISHTRHESCFALVKGSAIGVDIEKSRRRLEPMDIASYAFTSGEYAWLDSLGKSQRDTAFYRTWTRKEAVIKYFGGAVATDIDSFDVPLSLETGHWTIRPSTNGNRDPLILHDLNIDPGLYGSLCWKGNQPNYQLERITSDMLLRMIEDKESPQPMLLSYIR